MRHRRTSSVWWAFLGMLIVLPGCGDNEDGRVAVYPVRGELVIEGTAAEGAQIILHPLDGALPEGLRPNAEVAADGSFEVGTYTTGDGAPSGEYGVTLIWPKKHPGPPPYPDRFRGRYNNPQSPLWQVSIEQGENILAPFHLP